MKKSKVIEHLKFLNLYNVTWRRAWFGYAVRIDAPELGKKARPPMTIGTIYEFERQGLLHFQEYEQWVEKCGKVTVTPKGLQMISESQTELR